MILSKKDIKHFVSDLIFKSGYKINMTITGGGQSVISTIFQHPGASQAIQSAYVPYHKIALETYLGGWTLNKYCSADTAKNIAQVAYRDSIVIEYTDGFNIGVGVSSSIKTSPERKGREHRFFVCIKTKQTIYEFYGLLNNKHSRQKQEDLINNIIISLLVMVCNPSVFTEPYEFYFENLASELSDYTFFAA